MNNEHEHRDDEERRGQIQFDLAQTPRVELTLAQLQKKWEEVIDGGGGHCPVCRKWGKINPMTFTNSMAHSLIWLTKQPLKGRLLEDETYIYKGYADVRNTAPRWLIRRGTITGCKNWELITSPEPDYDRDGSNARKQTEGFWAPTEKGYQFARNLTKIPRRAFVYNTEVVGFSSDLVSIENSFKERFNYEEAMHGNFRETK